MKLAIAIPARWGSSRFPGKPLAMIGGKTMLARVVELAQTCTPNIFVTTEDQRIVDHAAELNVPCILTPDTCPTGSDRVLAALKQMDEWPDFVINLQGDAPFTPPAVLTAIIKAFADNPRAEVVTPVHQLSWADLDRLRESKKTTPFSGTTAVIDQDNRALWFSKNILPAIRNENDLRAREKFSPVFQHLGLYGFRTDILEKFCALPQGIYEQLEGLEQLRMIENGIKVTAVKVEIESGIIQSGIDTPEDVQRAEAMLK
jgi:3-deoxy-manno-octulosonate cytidylyltransferase (CMP-KDO synthetase)